MDDEWRKAIAPQWTARHEHTQKINDELVGLEKPTATPPTAAQIWEKARKLAELHGDGAAAAALEQVLTLEPKHAAANFILGRHHLQKDDPRGVILVETAMTADPALTQNGCNLLYAHFNRTGQRDKLRPLERRVDEFQKLTVLAQQERARISAADTFIAHELTGPQLAELRKIFSSEPDIGAVAVARKQVVHFPHSPCFVVGLQIKVAWWQPRGQKANHALVQRLLKQLRLSGYFLVFVNAKNLKGLGAKVLAAPNAVIYQRGAGN